MTCTIDWNVLNFSEWEQRFNSVPQSNILQSYPYAQAMAETTTQRPRFGLIKIDGKAAGMLQILEVGVLKNLIHGVILDRGPLWFDGWGAQAHYAAFIAEFNRQFPARIGRKRRFIPEMDDNDETAAILTAHNFKKQGAQGYETLRLDVTQDTETLHKNLKKNWRGSLKKAQTKGLHIEWDDKGQHFVWLMQYYMQDRLAKGYDGPSVTLLKAFAKYFTPRGELIIGRAMNGDKPLAGVMILCHGKSATYQIGYTGRAGRDAGAHHILLWDALSHLKNKGITDFDLGGINEETAKGVGRFKQGMGAQPVRLPGIFT